MCCGGIEERMVAGNQLHSNGEGALKKPTGTPIYQGQRRIHHSAIRSRGSNPDQSPTLRSRTKQGPKSPVAMRYIVKHALITGKDAKFKSQEEKQIWLQLAAHRRDETTSRPRRRCQCHTS